MSHFERFSRYTHIRIREKVSRPPSHAVQFASNQSGDSAAFFTLSRLEGEGFISSKYIRPTGTEKAKVLFKVTDEGQCVFADAGAQ